MPHIRNEISSIENHVSIGSYESGIKYKFLFLSSLKNDYNFFWTFNSEKHWYVE